MHVGFMEMFRLVCLQTSSQVGQSACWIYRDVQISLPANFLPKQIVLHVGFIEMSRFVQIFAFYGYMFFVCLFLFCFVLFVRLLAFLKTHLYCLVVCLSMIVWAHAVLDVLYACVLYFLLALVQFSAVQRV